MMETSLQELSFKSDISFFDEVSFILSVITSIISHPHMLNKGEEIVIRSELAPQISPDMFQRTIRDSRLWTEDNLSMVPENVYYYQQIDELRIYENIFIVNLIKKIDHELTKYNDFYVSMIKCFNGDNELSLKKDNQDIALKKMSYLRRKLKHIKNTYFYKVINKGSTKLGRVTPTNILVKDKLYNYCYKFYRRLITYDDRYKMLLDIRCYYYFKLIKILNELGFKLATKNVKLEVVDDSIAIPRASFKNKDFELELMSDDENIGLALEVRNLKLKNTFANHSANLLVFDDYSLFQELKISNIKGYDSVEAISLFNLAVVDNNGIHPIYDGIKNEDELIRGYLDSHIMVKTASTDIYNHYCPCCRSSMLDINENGVIECEDCKSKYVFYKNQEDSNDLLWFIKLRR